MAQSYHKQIKPFKHALSLIKEFHAADSDKNGSINAQELEKIRGLPLTKVANIRATLRRNGELSIPMFLDLCVDKFGPTDEFGKALKSAITRMNSGRGTLTGEELRNAMVGEGIQFSPSDSEELVASITNFGTQAVISFKDLELVVNALV
ncbi:uncharacterized protein [Primulina huaijiensis]|uniref:uncharacterized protein n=1 Tax=Primulina huaijiensis TaxID=1492673 RepID=UPI003CC6FF2C